MFSSDHQISPFFNEIFGNKMSQTWSKQLENEGIWALYKEGFPPFFHQIALS